MKTKMHFFGMATAIALFCGFQGTAVAQNFPEKPVRIIVPFPSGGAYDVLARAIGQKLSESMGQQVLADNRPGGNTIIGTELAAKSAPDGYTLLMVGVQSFAIVPSLFKKLPYDTVKDFAPISFVGYSPLILVVYAGLPVKSVKELIDLAKSKPGKLNFASSGIGGSTHLAGELFKSMTGVDIVHVSYKGSTPALTDLLGGQVDLMFDSMVSALPHVKSGKLRALAITSDKRSSAAPDVPTVAEAGGPGFKVDPWFGVVAPAGTPKEIVTKLNIAINKSLQLQDVKNQLYRLGVEPVGTTPDEFALKIKSEIEKWSKVVKEANVKVD